MSAEQSGQWTRHLIVSIFTEQLINVGCIKELIQDTEIIGGQQTQIYPDCNNVQEALDCIFCIRNLFGVSSSFLP